jgi:hypothetical protein
MLPDELKDWMRRGAMRAFVVSVLDESHRRIKWTYSVIMQRDWNP